MFIKFFFESVPFLVCINIYASLYNLWNMSKPPAAVQKTPASAENQETNSPLAWVTWDRLQFIAYIAVLGGIFAYVATLPDPETKAQASEEGGSDHKTLHRASTTPKDDETPTTKSTAALADDEVPEGEAVTGTLELEAPQSEDTVTEALVAEHSVADAKQKVAAVAGVIKENYNAASYIDTGIKKAATGFRIDRGVERAVADEGSGSTDFEFSPDNYRFASGSAVTPEDFEVQEKDWEKKKEQVKAISVGVLKSFKGILTEMFPNVEVGEGKVSEVKDIKTGRCIDFDRYKAFAEWNIDKSLSGSKDRAPPWTSKVDLKKFDKGETESLRKALLHTCGEKDTPKFRVVAKTKRLWSSQTKEYVNISLRWPKDDTLLATEPITLAK